MIWAVGVISTDVWKEEHLCAGCSLVIVLLFGIFIIRTLGMHFPGSPFPVVLAILVLQAGIDSPRSVNTTLDFRSVNIGSYRQPTAVSSAMRRVQSMSNLEEFE